MQRAGARVRIIAGTAFGERSPVLAASSTFYLHVELAAGAEVEIPGDAEEWGPLRGGGAG